METVTKSGKGIPIYDEEYYFLYYLVFDGKLDQSICRIHAKFFHDTLPMNGCCLITDV
jgi:hypothetical protein